MSELKEMYPDFANIIETMQLIQKINELQDCVKNIDKRVSFSQAELETNDDAIRVRLKWLEGEYDNLIKKISEIENIFQGSLDNIQKRLLILEDEILKFYRNKEKSFYDRMGDDIQNRILRIEGWLEEFEEMPGKKCEI